MANPRVTKVLRSREDDSSVYLMSDGSNVCLFYESEERVKQRIEQINKQGMAGLCGFTKDEVREMYTFPDIEIIIV